MNDKQATRVVLGAIEWTLALITLCLVRVGGIDKNPLVITSNDGSDVYDYNALLMVTAYGYFLIFSVQLVGTLLGDWSPAGVSKCEVDTWLKQ